MVNQRIAGIKSRALRASPVFFAATSKFGRCHGTTFRDAPRLLQDTSEATPRFYACYPLVGRSPTGGSSNYPRFPADRAPRLAGMVPRTSGRPTKAGFLGPKDYVPHPLRRRQLNSLGDVVGGSSLRLSRSVDRAARDPPLFYSFRRAAAVTEEIDHGRKAEHFRQTPRRRR